MPTPTKEKKTSHPTGTRDQWRAARLKLLEAEKALVHAE